MEQKAARKLPLKPLLKIIVSAVALYLVSRKIDVRETFAVIKSMDFLWLLLAFVLFNASQWLSAQRMLQFLKPIDINLKYRDSLLLYYVGMFYNLFLPGGIGGDGYKVYLLNNIFKTSVKKLIAALLHDRVNGLFGLASLLAILLMVNIPENFTTYGNLILFGCLLAVLAYFAAMRWVFKSFSAAAFPAYLSSMGIQGFQILTALCILAGLGLQDGYILYLQLFLISSIVSVIPVTIGGVGAREMVYVYGSSLFAINQNLAVAFTLLFFLITALSSLVGVIPSTRKLKERLGLEVDALGRSS